MSKFLRLPHMALNPRYIQRIDIHPRHYKIHLIQHDLDAWTMFGSGAKYDPHRMITVCAMKQPEEYHQIKTWLDKHT